MAIDPSAALHATAIVEPGAEVGPGCRIGPYCVVGPEVVLGPGVVLHSHVALAGRTRVGEATEVYPFASLGHPPQDLKYRGEPTELVIGARNVIREHATMNPGTVGGGGLTRVGDDNLFMMSSHVAHDCIVGNRCIMANNATLGGHCHVADRVILGGLSGVHQFVRIGRGAMVGGISGVGADVIPYGMITGDRGHLAGLNLVGLKRAGVGRAEIHGLRAAFDAIFRGGGTLQERARAAGERHRDNPLVQEVVAFITAESERSFLLPET